MRFFKVRLTPDRTMVSKSGFVEMAVIKRGSAIPGVTENLKHGEPCFNCRRSAVFLPFPPVVIATRTLERLGFRLSKKPKLISLAQPERKRNLPARGGVR